MGDGFGNFLKNVRDAALIVPIVGGWVQNIGSHDDDGTASSRFIENNFLKPGSMPIEKAMHGAAWFWDNGIAQPMSTFLLAGTHAETKGVGELLSGSAWAKAWHVANHVSPGQAFWANHPEVEEILKDRPLYAKPGDAYLPPGFNNLSEDEQQGLLKKAGMPVVGNRAVEDIKRDVSFFNFASGATDFAARWWLDPVVLGGKAVGAARTKYVVSPRPAGGWSSGDIDSLMKSSRMAKAQKFLWENKDNAQLINNLSMFKKSALGPRAGGIISQLKSPDEVNLFLRTTMGDAEARAQLKSENAAADLRMSAVDERLSKLELETMPRVRALANPNLEALATRRADQLRAQFAADEDLAARYKQMLGHYAELDALNLTKYSGSRAYTRTSNENNFRTGPALGTAGTDRSALSKSRIYANDLFGPSFTVVRSFKEAHPNGMIAVDDLHPEAIDELRGQIARIPGIGSDIRADLVNNYLKTTTEGERIQQLDDIQRLGVTKIAQKHGFTYQEGMALYREYRANITHGQEELRRYSGANYGDERTTADLFRGEDGSILRPHPNMVTKLANDQILIDFPALNKTLARNASMLKGIRTSRIGNPDWIVDGLDGLSHLWKFATLFRLGYIPRVLSDDLLGQVARVGAGVTALRGGYGVKNLATNLFHWKPASFYEGQEAVAREGVKFADEELNVLKPQADKLRSTIEQREAVLKTDHARALRRAQRVQNKVASIDQHAEPVKFQAAQQLLAVRSAEVNIAYKSLLNHSPLRKARLADLDDQLSELVSHRDLQVTAADAAKQARQRGFRQTSQLHKQPEVAPGVVLPPALGGEQGEYYQKMISSDDSLRTLLQRNKQMIHSNLTKSYNTKAAAPISYPGNERLFVQSWDKAINHQIMQDELAVQAVKGSSASEMARWLRSTPAGRAYRKRLGIKYDTPERIAQSVWHEVDEYMPVTSAGPDIRKAALEGKADNEFLTEAAKTGVYPQYVHSTQLGEALAGSNAASRSMDRVVDWWYKWAASIPADRMSRHPLFNQLYEGHARAIAGQELKQGVKLSQKDADQIAQTARRLALKDTRKLVFDIAHRTDAGAMLRFMSPFYAATTEAWQRWARIIADRPQTVGYASIFFNAPISWGWMQDADGNTVQKDGTAMVWDQKANRLVPRFVPKSERQIMARVPKFIADGPIGKVWGMDPSGNWKVSQDSMNLITQGDPWFNPGTGPIVSIPASMIVKDKPKQAELLRKLGVLPFGPTPGGITETVTQQSLPAYARNFLTAFDTSDERYQRIKLQIMQKAAYEHANLGKPMPSAQEIADRTRNYWMFSAVSAFTQPFSTQKPDQYQFYRDQYNALRRKNPMTADEEFLKRFDESYFIFAQSTTENVSGVPATMKAAELQQKYGNLIAKNPELASLIIGPEGNGPFSPEAYAYQLSTPLIPGGAEMQRTRMSADQAMQENQRRLGWAKFTQLNNAVTAQLHSAGYNSFEDSGAEQFKSMRSAIAKLMGDPLMPDGSQNPYYNEQWSKDYYTVDPKRYDRLIPALTAVAHSDLAKKSNRSDLRTLQQYLGYRQALRGVLAQRDKGGGSATLTAKSNADLATAWGRIVDGLIESDTRFGDLYNRYLSRDLGMDIQQGA
jgi:hypothetical protein